METVLFSAARASNSFLQYHPNYAQTTALTYFSRAQYPGIRCAASQQNLSPLWLMIMRPKLNIQF
jgi:hypothetical protein